MLNWTWLTALAGAALLTGCATQDSVASRDAMRMVMLEPSSQADDGLYVVAFEKAKGVRRLPLGKDGGACETRCIALDRLPAEVSKDARGKFDDPRPIFLSHIARVRGQKEAPTIKPCEVIYSAYQTEVCGAPQELTPRADQSALPAWSALEDDLYQKLDGEIKGRDVTHVVLMATGWKELQKSSLKHYADWSNGLDRELNHTGAWRPLYIGITWPAGWGGENPNQFVKNASLKNKMNDSDELGFGWTGILLHRTLAHLKTENPNLKIVLVGHSFGARMVSRATYSWPALKEACGAQNPDLLVGLQAAYSSARFIRDKGAEGSPFADFARCGPMPTFTSTAADAGMKIAFLQLFSKAKYVGGPQPDAMMESYNDTFTTVVVDDVGLPTTELPKPGKVVLLKSDQMICDHNDVHDQAATRLMARLVQEYAWSEPVTADNPPVVRPENNGPDPNDFCKR